MLPSRPRGVDPIISCTEREVIPIDEEISQKIPGIDFNLRNWICQNCSCYDYPEQILSHDNCRLLSKEEKSTLESILNSYMRIEEREDDDATAENSQMDQVLEYMKFEAKVLPLITCMTQSLDDSVAEQRVTRENYIEELCNMTEDGKLLYYDETGSPIIKFDEINKYKIDLVGILGKKYNVICFLRNRLKEQSMKLLEETFDKEGSGLYLMLPKSVSAAETNEGYLYFYSTNDEDYHCMNSQSRAVHFIRYMTELTRNIILLLDNKDKKLLSFKPESKSDSSRRIRLFQITNQEKEEKKSKVSQLGKIPIPSEDDCEKKIYCSSNGLVVALIKNPNKKQRQIGIYKNQKFFSLKEITDSSCISESKMSLKLFKLQLSEILSEESGTSTSKDAVGTLKFVKHQECDIEQADILNIFIIDSLLTLLVCNSKDGHSFFKIHNQSTQKKASSPKLRRPVSHCDFNSVSRYLCLVSRESHMVELVTYQFTEGFDFCDPISKIDLKKDHSVQSVNLLSLQGSNPYMWLVVNDAKCIIKVYLPKGTTSDQNALEEISSTVGTIQNIGFTPSGKSALVSNSAYDIHPIFVDGFKMTELFKLSTNQLQFFGLKGKQDAVFAAMVLENKLHLTRIDFFGARAQIISDNYENQTKTASHDKFKHWLHNFYAMFYKFTCHDLLSQKTVPLTLLFARQSTESHLDGLLRSTLALIEQDLKKTRKLLKTFSSSNLEIVSFEHIKFNTRNFMFTKSFERSIKEIVNCVLMITPLQIARCSRNCFTVLKNGKPISSLQEDVKDVVNMKDKISFGLIEAIIRHWNGPIKIISSMGKQSTGKSYLLNHLFGSSFNISGARCTDGCWMFLVIQETCMWVLLDFEGIGSFERTDQDDLLLSLFNSALSSATLYKTAKNFDRDTESLFSKFNAGSNQMSGLPNNFTGKFIIVVKDVPETDVDEVCEEFEEKMELILANDPEKCFLNHLYKGFEVRTFSNFPSKDFFNDVENLRKSVLQIQSKVKHGSIFLEEMKLLMAKLAINDFSPSTQDFVKIRVSELQRHLPVVIKSGQIILPDNSRHPLTIKDRSCQYITSKWKLSLVFGHETVSLDLDDTSFTLSEAGLESEILKFVGKFKQTERNFEIWRDNLEFFIEKSIETRFSRVGEWINENLLFWKKQVVQEYQDEIEGLMNFYTKEKEKIYKFSRLCDQVCKKCFLKCTQIMSHSGDHNCSTNHSCPGMCDY